MINKPEEIVNEAIKDPEKFYKTPESVLKDNRLTQEEKDEILHNWELDQLALIRAEEENMPPKGDAPSPMDLLEKIKKAEKIVEKPLKEEEKE